MRRASPSASRRSRPSICGWASAIAGSIWLSAALGQVRHRGGFQLASHRDAHEGKILLRPRAVELHIVRLGDFPGAHIADDADDFRRQRWRS